VGYKPLSFKAPKLAAVFQIAVLLLYSIWSGVCW